MKGKAIIFSAPSGAGKTTIVHSLLDRIPSLKFSISATTRHKRSTEVEGQDYHFLTEYQFDEKIKSGAFLEWEEVYTGIRYGTLKSEIEKIWKNGDQVIFDVDVKGGMRLKELLGKNALSIFVKVPNVKILEERLMSRMTEDGDAMKMRLMKAQAEMTEEKNFDEVVVNEDLETAIREAENLVKNFISE